MNKKILLIIPDVFDVSDKYKVSILGKYGTYLPLGPLYLAAIIENQGLEVKFIDNTLYEYPNDKLIEIILANSPDYLGFSTSFLNIYNAKEIARKVKQKNKKILTIFGGPQATHTAEELIKKPYVDYIIVGEGEKTIEELVSGKPPEKIAGLYSKQNNNPSYPGHRPPIEDLDSLPYPALHLADIAGYRQKSPNVIQLGALSSRGCPYHCTFCGLPPWLKKYRLRNPKKVVDEIEFITKNTTTIVFLLRMMNSLFPNPMLVRSAMRF